MLVRRSVQAGGPVGSWPQCPVAGLPAGRGRDIYIYIYIYIYRDSDRSILLYYKLGLYTPRPTSGRRIRQKLVPTLIKVEGALRARKKYTFPPL